MYIPSIIATALAFGATMLSSSPAPLELAAPTPLVQQVVVVAPPPSIISHMALTMPVLNYTAPTTDSDSNPDVYTMDLSLKATKSFTTDYVTMMDYVTDLSLKGTTTNAFFKLTDFFKSSTARPDTIKHQVILDCIINSISSNMTYKLLRFMYIKFLIFFYLATSIMACMMAVSTASFTTSNSTDCNTADGSLDCTILGLLASMMGLRDASSTEWTANSPNQKKQMNIIKPPEVGQQDGPVVSNEEYSRGLHAAFGDIGGESIAAKKERIAGPLTKCKSLEELRKLYRELAQEYHPDRNPSADATIIMQEINFSYDKAESKLKKDPKVIASIKRIRNVTEKEAKRIAKQEALRKLQIRNWRTSRAECNRYLTTEMTNAHYVVGPNNFWRDRLNNFIHESNASFVVAAPVSEKKGFPYETSLMKAVMKERLKESNGFYLIG